MEPAPVYYINIPSHLPNYVTSECLCCLIRTGRTDGQSVGRDLIGFHQARRASVCVARFGHAREFGLACKCLSLSESSEIARGHSRSRKNFLQESAKKVLTSRLMETFTFDREEIDCEGYCAYKANLKFFC